MLPKSAENISANECWRGATSSGLGQATSPSLFLNGFAMHRTPVPRSSRWAVEVLKQHARQDQPKVMARMIRNAVAPFAAMLISRVTGARAPSGVSTRARTSAVPVHLK
jgi:hypothetical protein